MTVGPNIETRGHIIGFKEEIEKAYNNSKSEFYKWFNGAGNNAEATFVRGCWDFAYHIARPLAKYITNPEDKTCLEIGYGGGRIIATAAKAFKNAIGIDIHSYNSFVKEELNNKGIFNIELLQNEGVNIPLRDQSIDVVYSFIVFQHLEKKDIFLQYVKEIQRVLKPHGIAIIYFGRARYYSLSKQSRLLYYLDCFLERILIPSGYKEMQASVNCTNLVITLPYAKNEFRKVGLDILETVVSKKNVPDGAEYFGGQHGLILRKPACLVSTPK